jgi:hypothetical protein
VPQVGDFVAAGEPLFVLHGGATAIDDHAAQASVGLWAPNARSSRTRCSPSGSSSTLH